ncbi:MAG: hypothetical protein ACI9DC_004868 [Gammaproteobacteria bacterium]|jgi:hypothetical protein
MILFYTLLGDALLFTALIWFAGYGGTGPLTGLRLTAMAKLRLFGEVFAMTFALLYLFIMMDQLLGWAAQPPWPGSPSPHRLIALGLLLTAGFYYTRRRSRALHVPLPAADSHPSDSDENPSS